MPADPEYDYIVVGSGAAGGVVAARLSEDPHVRVLLLEAGEPDSSIIFRVPGLGFLASSRPRYNWNFKTEQVPALNDRELIVLQGRVLGGSSSINGMIYTRGHSLEYDAWAQAGCTGWSFDGVLPYFRKAESNARGEGPWHGASGPFKVGPSRSTLPIYDAFLSAAAEAGFPVLDDLNRDCVDGFGLYDTNTHGGRRMSVAQAYLRPAERRPNLTIRTRSPVARVTIERGRATGVEILAPGGAVTAVRATREVIVSGGGIKSPQILMLSGIGPADALRAHGIQVQVDLPGVGRNLQNHPAYRLQYAVTEPITHHSYLSPGRALRAAAEYLFSGRGGLGDSVFGAGGFFRTDERLAVPDIQVVFASTLFPVVGQRIRTPLDLLPKQEGFSMVVYQGSPYSRGSVTLRSADPREPPAIAPNYFSDPRDMEVLKQGVQRMRDLARQPSLRKVVGRELTPEHAPDDAALEADIRRFAGTTYHQSGTCAMGVHATAVVDPSLRVRGIEGLRVADASIMPVMPNAALHGPTIMIGEKAADLIRSASH